MLSSFAVGVSGQRSPQSNIAENKNPLKVGANLAHIEKYTKVYRERYPNATIFLLRSYHNFFWSSERTIVSGTQPCNPKHSLWVDFGPGLEDNATGSLFRHARVHQVYQWAAIYSHRSATTCYFISSIDTTDLASLIFQWYNLELS